MAKSGTGRKTNKATKRRKAAPKGAMWPWYLVGLLGIGGIVAHDNLGMVQGWFRQAPHIAAHSEPAATSAKRRESETRTAAIPGPGQRPVERETLDGRAQALPAGLTPPQDIPGVQASALRPTKAGQFYFCTDQKTNCVIDGGNFWLEGRKIALADVSLPQMKKAKCDGERELGSQAKRRLREILNSGDFKLLPAKASGGAAVRTHVVLSDGTLISDHLIAEGLAHSPKDATKSWC